jgi:hypothetical protein
MTPPDVIRRNLSAAAALAIPYPGFPDSRDSWFRTKFQHSDGLERRGLSDNGCSRASVRPRGLSVKQADFR